jgi:hypothetical protein
MKDQMHKRSVITLTERGDSKVTWITCPDCGAKIGVVISVGKAVPQRPQQEPEPTWPPSSVNERLTAAGVDLTLVDVVEGEHVITISPKKFLGDLWGPINEAVRSLNGGWIREGRDSRWEIRKEELA